MSRRRSTEQLLADAEERLRLTADLPAQLGRTRGSAVNDAGTVRAVVTVHGALTELVLDEVALRMGPRQLGQEIVRLADEANAVALEEGIGLLSRAIGDEGTTELAQAVGLEHLVSDAPVVPYVPGEDPNAGQYLPPRRHGSADRPPEPAPADGADVGRGQCRLEGQAVGGGDWPAGTDPTDSERPGPDHAGPDHAGPVHAGPVHAGPDHAGPDHADPGYADPVQVDHDPAKDDPQSFDFSALRSDR